MTLWDRSAILEGASLAPAPAPPATIGERAEIDWRVFRDQQMLDSDTVAIDEAYSGYVDELESLTGKRLETPSQRMTAMGGNPGFVKRSRADAYLQEQSRKQFDADLQALAREFPEIPIRTREDILRRIGIDRAQQRRQQAEITARTVDWPVSVAGFGATATAAMTEPLVLASMAFGAPYSAGIIRTALTEGGIAMATEAPIQLGVQLGRRKFGEEASFSEGLTAILSAGAGGFLFGGLLRAAAKAPGSVRALLERSRSLPEASRTAEVRAAEEYLTRAIEADEVSPYVDTPEGRAAHVERLAEAERALAEGRAAELRPAAARTARQGLPTAEAGLEGPAADTVRQARQAALQRQELDQQARGVAEALAPLLDDPRALEAVLRDVQARPAKAEGLLSYLHRSGGVVDEGGELAALGMTPRTRPGLLRKQGRSLDDAALQAQEEGFFPGRDLEAGDRVSVQDFLDAVDRELRGQRVLRAADEQAQMGEAMLEELRNGLSAAGIEPQGMRPEQFRQAVSDLVQEIAERDRGAELARMGRAGADAADVEERLAMMSEEDLLDEGDVLRAYEGREDEMIAIEDEDGVRRMSVRQMLDELQRDQEDFAALKVCVTGGGRG